MSTTRGGFVSPCCKTGEVVDLGQVESSCPKHVVASSSQGRHRLEHVVASVMVPYSTCVWCKVARWDRGGEEADVIWIF